MSLAQAKLHRVDASSTSELVVELAQELGAKFSSDMATCLLTGLYTDTGGFQHSNTTPRCMDVAAELLRRGGKLQLIVRALEQSKSMASLRLLGLALERASQTNGKRCLVSVLAQDDFVRLSASDEELPGVVGELNNMPDGRITVFISEAAEGTIRVMLRVPGDSTVRVNRLARLLGGGGHAKAAGVSLSGHIVKKKNRFWIEAAKKTG